MSLSDRLRRTAVWRSVFRQSHLRDDRSRARVILNNIFLHLHPVRMPKSAIRLRYTWGMGALCAILFAIEVVTGIMLMFYYRPTPEHAYLDMVDLAEQVPFGIVREMHRWAAHLMVVTVWLHMLRVFLTGSYKPPRQFNWVVGVFLLVLTMFLSFTGYLLPWDQLSYWAITVGSNMARSVPFLGQDGPGAGALGLVHAGNDIRFLLLGGRTVGANALLRFYVLHCVLVPLATVVLMAVHFWRIRRDGGMSGPEAYADVDRAGGS